MYLIYSTISVEVPAGTVHVEPILTATATFEPNITGILNNQGNNYNTILIINGLKVCEIPIGFEEGFQRFFPFLWKMKKSDVASVGFYNHTGSPSTLRLTLQYSFI